MLTETNGIKIRARVTPAEKLASSPILKNLMKILRELKNGLNPMRIEEMLQWVSKKNSDHKRCREFMIQ